MTTTTDFRALCAELLQVLDENRHHLVRYPGHWCHWRLVMDRARTALAEPEPPADGEVAVLVAELNRIAEDAREARQITDAQSLTRAATLLEQLSAPAPVVVPIPVAERLPVAGDCDAEGRCWWFSGDWHLKQVRYRGAYDNHWLSYHAIPLPQAGEGQP
jgi:hypothetical protein